MKTLVETVISTKIIEAATGRIVKERAPEKNLVLDGGLNNLAGSGALMASSFPASISAVCLIGSGNTANSTSSGAITFTQSTTTVTASAAFFTSGMVGAILKYGTGSGGVEYYITAFTDSTHVTVNTSATVAATVGTVWFVQRTTLDSFLFSSSTYQTNAGDCGTTVSGNTVTHKRTYIFAQQSSPYTVNEIGYARQIVSNRILGRVVLSSSDVVGITNFYVVVISITFTYLPSTPASVANVGVNINTAGTLALETVNSQIFGIVGTSGNIGAQGLLDNGGSPSLMFATATYTQNSSPNTTTTPAPARLSIATAGWVNNASVVGQMTVTYNGSISTSGQSLFGIALGSTSANQYSLDILFTTTQTAPTGTFQPNTVWSLTYTRTLVN